MAEQVAQMNKELFGNFTPVSDKYARMMQRLGSAGAVDRNISMWASPCGFHIARWLGSEWSIPEGVSREGEF